MFSAVSGPHQRPTLPPSVLPDISPTRGKIGSSTRFARPAAPEIGAGSDNGVISPLVGGMSGRTEGGNVELQTGRNGGPSC